jgi:hypothetical protein
MIKASVVTAVTDIVGGGVKIEEGKVGLRDGFLPDIIMFMALYNTVFTKNAFDPSGGTQTFKEDLTGEMKGVPDNWRNALENAKKDSFKKEALDVMLKNLGDESKTRLRSVYEVKEKGVNYGRITRVLSSLYSSIGNNLKHISSLPSLLQGLVYTEISLRLVHVMGVLDPTLTSGEMQFLHGSFVSFMENIAKCVRISSDLQKVTDTKLLGTIYNCADNVREVLASGKKGVSRTLLSLLSSAGALKLENKRAEPVQELVSGLEVIPLIR